MNDSNSGTKDLRASLAQFEQALETPIVPGEAVSWFETVTAHGKAIGKDFRSARENTYGEMYEQITREDPALQRRVEELRADEQRLVHEHQIVLQRLQQLQQKAARVEPDEAKLETSLQEAVQQALMLIIDMRKLDAATTTWYQEALQRDRGVAD
jgi:hypothetical protein